ncbi:MAG: VWA domain-containing protein [Clostridiales bacterium]|nr:VWA domain-containing protein [Clostridiales bacterium]
MKKSLTLLLAFCLLLSAPSPIITKAEEIKTPEAAAEDITNIEETDNQQNPGGSGSQETPEASQEPEKPEASQNPENPDDSENKEGSGESEDSSDSEDSEDAKEPKNSEGSEDEEEPKSSEKPEEKQIDPEALYEIFISLTDDTEIEQFLQSLSPEELLALEEYVAALYSKNIEVSTVPVTRAGPLVSPVTASDAMQSNSQGRHMMNFRSQFQAKDTEGVEVHKSVSPNSDGTYKIRLESYTTGAVVTKTTGVPADIILVLDQSGSMAYDFEGNSGGYAQSRQKAMKDSIAKFIDAVAADAAGYGADHYISIVTFADDAATLSTFSNDYNSLKNSINDLPQNPQGATNAEAGMNRAKELFDSVEGNSGRNKVVVVFTDGVPTSQSDFNTTMASNAISTAKRMKQNGATVYTIGIFSGANPNELHGEKFDYSLYSDIPCSGAVGSVWGASFFKGWFGDVRFIDIAAGNRFLNYLSSNYAGADNVGIANGYYNPGNHMMGGNGYMITQNFTRTALSTHNYYLSASDTSSLNDIFQRISEQIGAPTTTLGSNAEVRDIVSDYFDIHDESNINVSTIACTGKTGGIYTWEDDEISFSDAQVSIDRSTKTISVKGFSYDEEFVSENKKPDKGHGKKLVVSFDVKPKDGFWGGNEVPTNNISSGIYEGDNLVESFEMITADVPINVPFIGKNTSIYLGNTVSIENLYLPITTPSGEDSWKADFVDVSEITYSATFTAKPTDDQANITVTATVPPLHSGSIANKTETAVSSITVYKPEITFSDSTIYLGEKADYAENVGSLSWKHGAVTADSDNVQGTAPELTYTYGPESSCFKSDTPVDVTVKAGDWDITQYVTFVNNGTSHAGSASDKEFAVNVKTCTLTVSKSGCKESYGSSQTFVLRIKGSNLSGCDYADEVDLTVVVKGSGSKIIIGLPIGVYSVQEEGNWSWRYAAASTTSVTLNCSNPSNTISISNTLINKAWLSGSNYMENKFK